MLWLLHIGIAALLSLLGLQAPSYAATITTINGSDQISTSRTTINTNFSNLNTNKFELSDWFSTSTARQLTTFGTITTGVWSATPIAVIENGTGTTSPTTNQVMLGNGASGFKVVNGLGTSGQSLVSNGAGIAPSWQSISFDTTANYTLTGTFTHNKAVTVNATTTIAASSTSANALILNGLSYAFPSSCTGSSTVLSTDGSGNITCEQPFIKTLVLNTNIGVAVTNSSATTTGYFYVVPASTLTTTSMLHAKVTLVASGSNLCWGQLDMGNGTATTTLGIMSIQPGGNTPVQMGADIAATSTTDLYGAFSAFNNQVYSTNSTFGGYGGTNGSSGGFAHINTAAQWYLDFRARINSGGTGSCNFDAVSVTLERQQ